MKMVPPEFLIIPYQLIEDENITPLDERVYGIIYWLTRLKGEKCTAGNTTLSSLAKSTPQTVNNSLLRLEKGQYIQRIFKDPSNRHRKEIIPLIVFSRITSASVSGKLDTSGNVSDTSASVSPDTSHSVQNKNIVKKSTKEENSAETSSVLVVEVIDLFKEINPAYKDWFRNKTQRSACQWLISEFGLEQTQLMVAALPKINGMKYAPTTTSPYELKTNYAKLKAFAEKERSKIKSNVAFQ